MPDSNDDDDDRDPKPTPGHDTPSEPPANSETPPAAARGAMQLWSPRQLPALLENDDLGEYAQRWRSLSTELKKERRPEFRALIVDYEDQADANKTNGNLTCIVAGSIGGSLTVTGGVFLATKVAAGAAITALVAAPAAIGALTLAGALCIASYFYKTGRQQQTIARKAAIILDEDN